MSPRAAHSAPMLTTRRIDWVRMLFFWSSAVVAAAMLAGAAYWTYRHLQPEPLFAPTSVNASEN